MKVIIAGATGYIGGTVVRECIANPKITSILLLSRKELATEVMENPKVHFISHQDFGTYPPELLEQLQGAEGCIWAIGGKVEDFPNIETARRISIDFTHAAARAFAETLAPSERSDHPFRFVFVSGQGAEWDPNARVILFPETRKIKGAVEKGLFDIVSQHPAFDVVTLRPGGVLSDEKSMMNSVALKLIPSVTVSTLAKGLVAACLSPPTDKIVENKDIPVLAESV